MSEIKGTLAKLTKQKGADMALNTSRVMVIYADKSLDVSQEAIKILNATDSKK